MKNGADISGSLCAEVTKIGVNSAPDFYRCTAGRQQLAFAVWVAFISRPPGLCQQLDRRAADLWCQLASLLAPLAFRSCYLAPPFREAD